MLISKSRVAIKNCNGTFLSYVRNATVGFTHFKEEELTPELKRNIELHWRNKLVEKPFDSSNVDNKFYVLSMFPYPSGKLHMGHVRVYAISDAMARYYRMNGKNVLHPMGWDAFGLPAENAANQLNIPAAEWTKQNIAQMKEQLISLGCSFDWDRELSTCDPSYYKWTQISVSKTGESHILYREQLLSLQLCFPSMPKALVNWDPIDKTVLANEQVDEEGHSWRSGAKVEKKLLRQWFIKATEFSKALYDGLSSPHLEDWQDIVKLQKHWIGECDGFTFDLPTDSGDILNVWTDVPEHFENAAFVAISRENDLNKDKISGGLLNIRIKNPFNGKTLPIVVTDEVKYPPYCDTYLGLPSVNESDKEFALRHQIQVPSEVKTDNEEEMRQKILSKAHSLKIGGYASSSKLKDWLISRQRSWGTPIPIIHCGDCGAVPVKECDLPILHSQISDASQLKATCPKCKNPNAHRESDTMDTFVDSSWYFLRYLDSKNGQEMFDKRMAKCMPVDLYIGGKEHAVLHLYYARFMNHFLHRIGLVPEPEPFKRLLVQGMVMGQSYRVKETGKYLKECDVKIDENTKTAVELSTGQPVVMEWEKMSKSKLNGVDPADAFEELSVDSVRLIILGDVAPRSNRNWSSATFPGILDWQRRIWLTLHQFYKIRSDDGIKKRDINDATFRQIEDMLAQSRNHIIAGVTYNYKYAQQLSVAVTKKQALTKSIRRAPKEVIKYGGEYERALASLIIMIAPMAPHFASELWSQFIRVPNRINASSSEINWDLDVLEQSWPKVDENHALDLKVKFDGNKKAVSALKFTHNEFMKIDSQLALKYAMETPEVKAYLSDKKFLRSNYVYHDFCHGSLLIQAKKLKGENLSETFKILIHSQAIKYFFGLLTAESMEVKLTRLGELFRSGEIGQMV
ncbi:putative leucine--tRNA ligase, mitochondrial [Pseudolycoriella hygida]|uniref:leucine--tRNA ligase n=1 Tax=Pseudolycoriella hygida TaxID=35572 RepID=A0A9Q0S7Y7_9DIPT|nr:putative leucine--tRNA ligase, mitochondrial [Pseudolycoriella hygida]